MKTSKSDEREKTNHTKGWRGKERGRRCKASAARRRAPVPPPPPPPPPPPAARTAEAAASAAAAGAVCRVKAPAAPPPACRHPCATAARAGRAHALLCARTARLRARSARLRARLPSSSPHLTPRPSVCRSLSISGISYSSNQSLSHCPAARFRCAGEALPLACLFAVPEAAPAPADHLRRAGRQGDARDGCCRRIPRLLRRLANVSGRSRSSYCPYCRADHARAAAGWRLPCLALPRTWAMPPRDAALASLP